LARRNGTKKPTKRGQAVNGNWSRNVVPRPHFGLPFSTRPARDVRLSSLNDRKSKPPALDIFGDHPAGGQLRDEKISARVFLLAKGPGRRPLRVMTLWRMAASLTSGRNRLAAAVIRDNDLKSCFPVGPDSPRHEWVAPKQIFAGQIPGLRGSSISMNRRALPQTDGSEGRAFFHTKYALVNLKRRRPA